MKNQDGQPLDAVITVDGIDHPVKTDPQNGDYYRLLRPDRYTIRANAPGYKEAKVVLFIEQQTAFTASVFDFILEKQ